MAILKNQPTKVSRKEVKKSRSIPCALIRIFHRRLPMIAIKKKRENPSRKAPMPISLSLILEKSIVPVAIRYVRRPAATAILRIRKRIFLPEDERKF